MRRRSLRVLDSLQQQEARLPLRQGWHEAYDHSRGATYYFHAQTRLVSWVRPTDVDPQQQAREEAALVAAVTAAGETDAEKDVEAAASATAVAAVKAAADTAGAADAAAAAAASTAATTAGEEEAAAAQLESFSAGHAAKTATSVGEGGAPRPPLPAAAAAAAAVATRAPVAADGEGNEDVYTVAPLTESSIGALHGVFERFCVDGLSQAQCSDMAPPELDASRFFKLITEAGLGMVGAGGGRQARSVEEEDHYNHHRHHHHHDHHHLQQQQQQQQPPPPPLAPLAPEVPMSEAEADLCFSYAVAQGVRRVGFEAFLRTIIPACAASCFPSLPLERGALAVESAFARATPRQRTTVGHADPDRGAEIVMAEAAVLRRMTDHKLCAVAGSTAGVGAPQVQRGAHAEQSTHAALMRRAMPPADASVRLRALFDSFCSFGKTRTPAHGTAQRAPHASPTLDNARFAKLGRDCGLLDRRLTSNRMDLIFARALNRGERTLTFTCFVERALPLLAQHKFAGAQAGDFSSEEEKVHAMVALLLACKGPRVAGLQHSSKSAAVSSPVLRDAERKHFRSSRFDQ